MNDILVFACISGHYGDYTPLILSRQKYYTIKSATEALEVEKLTSKCISGEQKGTGRGRPNNKKKKKAPLLSNLSLD